MGSNQSAQAVEEDEEDEESEEEEEEEEEEEDNERLNRRETNNHLVKKVLEQEPEMLPCHASASPLSPQLSSLGTPRLGPSIKVWDPYNVLAPPPPLPPPPVFSRLSSMGSSSVDDDRMLMEVFLISHGECELNERPELVAGRCHGAGLTTNGKRQARALAVFLNSHRVRFNAVYTSPLDRSRSTAVSVCQEMNFAEDHIQTSEALVEMSMGDWEGCHQSEVYTPDTVCLIERYQPDFSAPSGESLRQVEFRMVQFLNDTVLQLPEKIRSDFSLIHPSESQEFSQNSNSLPNSAHDRISSPHMELLNRPRPGLSRKKSGKSRLQVMSVHEVDGEILSPSESHHQNELRDMHSRGSSSSSSPTCIGLFTHSVTIKCLLTGILGCSPLMSHKICIEDSSVTVLQHSWRTGWQIKRLNDTAHLRLL